MPIGIFSDFYEYLGTFGHVFNLVEIEFSFAIFSQRNKVLPGSSGDCNELKADAPSHLQPETSRMCCLPLLYFCSRNKVFT